MTTKHTPGRLAIKDRLLDGRCQFTILGGDGAIVAGVDARDNVLAGFGKENDARSRCADGQQEAWANAEHLVACWNACEGINPEAVPEIIRAAETVIECWSSDGSDVTGAHRLAAALAKARGEA